MEDFASILDIIIRLGIYAWAVFILGGIVWFILKEFGGDILKGKMKLGDYINLGIGVVILVFLIINSGAVIGYATLVGFQRAKPYIVAIQEEVVGDIGSIIYGSGGTVVTVPENTVYTFDSVFPEQSNVPTQTPETIFVTPTQAQPQATPEPTMTYNNNIPPNVTIIPSGESSPELPWYSESDLP